MTNRCPSCGAPYGSCAAQCEYCGTLFGTGAETGQVPVDKQAVNLQHQRHSNLPVKSRMVAALLALLIGGSGAHKFYLGRIKSGILMLLFCWTYIPTFIGFVEGIILLTTSDQAFMEKYKCRIK